MGQRSHSAGSFLSPLFWIFIVWYWLVWLSKCTIISPIGARPCGVTVSSGWWTFADARMCWNTSGHIDLLPASVQIHVETPNQLNNNRNTVSKKWSSDVVGLTWYCVIFLNIFVITATNLQSGSGSFKQAWFYSISFFSQLLFCIRHGLLSGTNNSFPLSK